MTEASQLGRSAASTPTVGVGEPVVVTVKEKAVPTVPEAEEEEAIVGAEPEIVIVIVWVA